MTNYEKQIKSMLNYYEIDFAGKRDEKMNKKDLQKFINTLNSNYDAQVVQDILSKIKDKFKNRQQEEENDDPFFNSLDSLNENDEETNSPLNNPLDMSGLYGRTYGKGNLPFGLNADIENFINWLSDTLYSSDHKIVITEENGITNIRLEKIKKKGGGKK